MKPLIKIAIVVIAIIILGVAGYFAWDFFSGPKIEPPVTPTSPESGLPIVPADQGPTVPLRDEAEPPVIPGGSEPGTASYIFAPKKLSDSPVFFAWESYAASEVLYITPEGRIFSVREGPDLEMSTQTFAALNSAEPSPDGNRLLAAFGDPRNPEWRIFDTLDRSWHPLPSGTVQAAWGMGLNDIIATVRTGTGTTLSRIDVSKTPPLYTTLVSDFRLRDITLTALSSTTLVVVERPSALVEGRVWRFDTKSGLLAAILPGAAGRMVGATPDRQVIFSFATPDRFYLFNQLFQELTPLPVWTFPAKCGGNASVVYCFVPSSIPEKPQPIIPDAYLARTLRTVDDLYRIDLTTDAVERLFTARESSATPAIDGTNLLVSGQSLYFVNASDNGLYVSALP